MGQRNCERAKDKKKEMFFLKKNEKKGGRKCCIVTERESPSIWKLEDFAFYLHHLLPALSFFRSFVLSFFLPSFLLNFLFGLYTMKC